MPQKPGRKGRFEENHVLTPLTETMRLSKSLADEIGLVASVLLLQFDFWISISNHKGLDGHDWTYQSLSDLSQALPWSESTIARALKSLQSKKLILVGNYNRRKGDRTQWFALNTEEIRKLRSVTVRQYAANQPQNETSKFQSQPSTIQNGEPVRKHGKGSSQNGTASIQNGTTLPNTSTNITSDNEANISAYTTSLIAPSNDGAGRKQVKGDVAFEANVRSVFEERKFFFPDSKFERDSLKQICQWLLNGTFDFDELRECIIWMNRVFKIKIVLPSTVVSHLPTYKAKFKVERINQNFAQMSDEELDDWFLTW
jgi:hypothetical protein